jgi:hypothetical protein
MAEPTAQKLPAHLRDDLKFKPGQSGNPNGRPKGSRNKLSEDFVADILADWTEHGAAVIGKVRQEKPTEYLKVVAGVITKDVNVTVRDYDELSDAELAEQFAAAAARLAGGHAPRGRAGAQGYGEGGPGTLPH